jgi:hypothetical protein
MIRFYIGISSLVGALIWLIVGFTIWIPVLLVATSNFCFAIIRSSLENNPVDPDVMIILKNKIDMYSRGFRNFELIVNSYPKYHEDN